MREEDKELEIRNRGYLEEWVKYVRGWRKEIGNISTDWDDITGEGEEWKNLLYSDGHVEFVDVEYPVRSMLSCRKWL